MKLPILLITFCLLNIAVYGQSVNNIRAELDRLNRQIIISYNLERGSTNTQFDKFEVAVYISADSGKTFEAEPLTYVKLSKNY